MFSSFNLLAVLISKGRIYMKYGKKIATIRERIAIAKILRYHPAIEQ